MARVPDNADLSAGADLPASADLSAGADLPGGADEHVSATPSRTRWVRLPGKRLLMRLAAVGCVLVGVPEGHASAWTREVDWGGYARVTPLAWEHTSAASAPVPANTSGRGPSRDSGELRFGNLLHLRQNLRWYPSFVVTGALEVKERVWAGEDMAAMFGVADQYTLQEPYLDLSWRFLEEPDAIGEATVDRLWINLVRGDFEARVGRQRVAWGTNLVWNPLDLFNRVSPLDFDNEEKPGTDALRLQYFLGPTSLLDLAAAPARDADQATAAIRAQFNRWGYDGHLVAGRRGPAAIAGLGWAGSIGGGGFRGEALWSLPRDDEPAAHLVSVVSGDYTFSSGLYLHAAVLYNERGAAGPAGGLALQHALERGDLSPARWSTFAQLAKDIMPLHHLDLAVIHNLGDGSSYLGPSWRWSLRTNLDLTLMAFLFRGAAGTEFGDNGQLGMIRLKYSF